MMRRVRDQRVSSSAGFTAQELLVTYGATLSSPLSYRRRLTPGPLA